MQNNKLTFLFALYENSNYVKKRAGSLREICKNIGFQDSSNNYEKDKSNRWNSRI